MSIRILRAGPRLAIGGALLIALLAFDATQEPAPAAALSACAADERVDAEERAFLTLVNNHRAQNGRAPLGLSHSLSRAAAWKSKDMGVNRYFAHDDLGRTWVQRIRDCGYGYNTYIGENIAAGVSSAQAAFDLWKNSSGHNANMLNANYRTIGIGREYTAGSPYGWYWTTEFGGVDDGYAEISEPRPIEVLPAPEPESEADPVRVETDTTASTLTVYVRRHRYTVHVTARAADDVGIARVEFWRDGVLLKSDGLAPYTAIATKPRRSDGRIDVVAYDASGNASRRTVR